MREKTLFQLVKNLNDNITVKVEYFEWNLMKWKHSVNIQVIPPLNYQDLQRINNLLILRNFVDYTLFKKIFYFKFGISE